MNIWAQAKMNIPRCERCEDWNKRGLSSRCPECDTKIIAENERLQELKDTKEGLGVLFEAGSGKYIKLINEEGKESAKFYSNWKDASQIEGSKYHNIENRQSMFEIHGLWPYRATIEWLLLGLFYKEEDNG